jgi:alpha-soluble NSF attachment protein
MSSPLRPVSFYPYTRKVNTVLLTQQDLVATNRALQVYVDLDNSFASTREHQLLVDLTEAVEQGEQEAFADKLYQYDQLSKLDKWKTTLLLRIKNDIEETGEDFS